MYRQHEIAKFLSKHRLDTPNQQVLYYESTSWGIWTWSVFIFLISSLALALVVSVNFWIALILLLSTISITIYFWKKSKAQILITANWLLIGKAKIELKFLNGVTTLNKFEFKAASGRNCDPDAFLYLRPWIQTGVKIELRDDLDPTPYLLISCKNPLLLAKALAGN